MRAKETDRHRQTDRHTQTDRVTELCPSSFDKIVVEYCSFVIQYETQTVGYREGSHIS